MVKALWITLASQFLLMTSAFACSCMPFPDTSYTILEPGVVERNISWPEGMNLLVQIDTLHKTKLLEDLENLYSSSAEVFQGTVIGTERGYFLDNNRPNPNGGFYATVYDSVFIRVDKVLKGDLEEGQYISLGKFYDFENSCDYGYSSIDGWEFLNFSNGLDELEELSIYPAQACSEAGGIRIGSEGITHSSYPPFTVSSEEFFNIAHSPLSIDNKKQAAMKKKEGWNLLLHHINSSFNSQSQAYSINGKQLAPSATSKLPQGMYIERLAE